jgi:hypothetical protein
MDLDLELAFFDVNDVSFLDLMGTDMAVNAPTQSMPQPPKQPVQQPRSPGILQMMSAGHLAHDIDFSHDPEPQPISVSEEFSLEQAAGILSGDLPEITSLPALSPQQSSTTSSQPSASDPNHSPPHICSCLASLYLALDSLQHLPKSACAAIKVARSASRTAYNTITCPVCSTPPLDPTSPEAHHPPIQSLQNMMMLGALLPSLSNAYKTILRTVDEEAHAATFSSPKIPFDLSSYGGLWGPIAAPACGVVDTFDGRKMEPAMWRLTVRALLKADVYGFSDCTPGWEAMGFDKPGQPLFQPGLKDIIQMMEERSRNRHEEIDRLVKEGVLRFDDRCEYIPLDNPRGEKPTCFRIIDLAKRSMQSLDIP